MKAKNADPQLQSRGYTRVGSERSDKNHSWGMWWNPSSRQCLTVAYARGKVEDITDSPPNDCNQDQHHSSGNNNDGDSVPQSQMQKYCQGEASAKLDVRPNYISTLPVERSGDQYVVYGQSPTSGSNVTLFECTFNKHGVFRGVEVTQWANQGGNNSSSNELPSQARRKCLESFGGSAKITTVTPLRPGYWEVILQNNAGTRMAACTVSSGGEIQDWAEMN